MHLVSGHAIRYAPIPARVYRASPRFVDSDTVPFLGFCLPASASASTGLQVIINFNALPWLLNLLSSSKKGIRKEACWTISNITAGNKEQIQAVIEANIIPPLIQLLSNAEFDIRKVWEVRFGFQVHASGALRGYGVFVSSGALVSGRYLVYVMLLVCSFC